MWTLLWLLATGTGGLTSGASDFPSKDACEDAAKVMREMAYATTTGSGDGSRPVILSPFEIRCVSKVTGRR